MKPEFKGSKGNWCSRYMNDGTIKIYVDENKRELARLYSDMYNSPTELAHNVNIMTAAPELLEALQIMEEVFYPVMDSRGEQDQCDALKQARAAINKALGK